MRSDRDLDIVWSVIENDLQPLKSQIQIAEKVL